MKLLLVLGAIVGGYMYLLMHTTGIVLMQAQRLNNTYQYVANNSEQLAGVPASQPR